MQGDEYTEAPASAIDEEVREGRTSALDGLPEDARPYPGDTRYHVTPGGEVFSTRSGKVRRLNPWTHVKGYQRVALGGSKVYVHRLVLLAHTGPLRPGTETRHLDGDPANNRLANLRAGSAADNAADRIRHGTAAKKLDADKVRAIRAASGSQRAIAKRFGIAQATVSAIKRCVVWRHVDAEPVQLALSFAQRTDYANTGARFDA